MELTGHMKNRFLWLVVFSLSVLFTACEEKKEESRSESKGENKAVKKEPVAPFFNGDSAYVFIKKQVDFGPRVPNSSAHRKCGEYLVQQLRNYGWEVYTQQFEATAFDGTRLNLTNIIGSYRPDLVKRVLLAAHWDTRPFADQDTDRIKEPIDGANDGASGVGALLEIARVVNESDKKPAVGVDIIFFDGEDYGQPDFAKDIGRIQDSWCLGSQHWAKNKHLQGYSAFYGILLDMVGAANARFAMEGTSMHFAPSVVNKVWQTARDLGYGQYFVNVKTPAIIDDHTYVNEIAGLPMIDIIEYNMSGDGYFGDYWHTHNDNIDVIDPATLKAVGQTVLEVLYNER